MTQKALDTLIQSLPLLRALGNREAEAVAHVFIGFCYLRAGEGQKARTAFAQALPLARGVSNSGVAVLALNGLGLSGVGQSREALDYLTQTLSTARDLGDRPSQADTLNGLGLVHLLSGRTGQALDSFGRALYLYRKFGDRHGEATALLNVAFIEVTEHKLTEACAHVEAALSIFESLRTDVVNQELRVTYFSTVQDYYDFYIELLMLLHEENPSAGHDGEALHASERARARALLETLAEANADIREGVDLKLVERERALKRRLDAKAQEQMKLLAGSHTDEQANGLAKELETLTTQLQQVETKIRQTSPQYAALTQPHPLSLKEIQTEVLDPDTILLEYSLGKEGSYLWAVSPTGIASYELPQQDQIEAAARRVYELLNARNKRSWDETRTQREARIVKSDGELPVATAALSQMLLAPVASQLGNKRLVIVADGLLQFIPFGALPVPASAGSAAQQPLIVEHEIISLPSASMLAVLRREVAGRKPAPKTVVVLADPVFLKNDERIKGAAKGTLGRATGDTQDKTMRANADSLKELQLVEAAQDTGLTNGGLYVPRLAGSRKEAEEIVAMVSPAQSRLALDFEASRAVATSAELSQYRYVHFSTHGFLNSVHPELSGIVFSLVNERGETQDGFLRAHEIFNLKLPAEVVVLSACQTGIGKEVKGEGLVSLTRGFMYAGAPRVVVSLWSVSEMGTTELMVRFYQQMLKEGLRPAAALRAAQISLMKEKRWSSPFYWAPFVLQGEWR